MKVRYAPATGCPFGQFVVSAETDEDRALLNVFLLPASSGEHRHWRFHLHGFGGVIDYTNKGWGSFNFGWYDERKLPIARRWWQKLVLILLALCVACTSATAPNGCSADEHQWQEKYGPPTYIDRSHADTTTYYYMSAGAWDVSFALAGDLCTVSYTAGITPP